MAPGEFCVLCGRTGRPLQDGVCVDCAAERTVLVSVPPQVELVVCPTCGSRLEHGRWERRGSSTVVTADDLAPFLTVHPEVGIRALRWTERGGTPTLREVDGEARVRFRGAERTVPLSLKVRLIGRTCTDCGRRSGRYYTALLQLRGEAAPRTPRPKRLRARLDRAWAALAAESRPEWRDAVGWREELPEGWDVYFTDTLAARAVARLAKQRFGAPIVESASLFGRKNGQDVYRVTFCVRLPEPALDAIAGTSEPAAAAAWNDTLKKRPRRRNAER